MQGDTHTHTHTHKHNRTHKHTDTHTSIHTLTCTYSLLFHALITRRHIVDCRKLLTAGVLSLTFFNIWTDNEAAVLSLAFERQHVVIHNYQTNKLTRGELPSFKGSSECVSLSAALVGTLSYFPLVFCCLCLFASCCLHDNRNRVSLWLCVVHNMCSN